MLKVKYVGFGGSGLEHPVYKDSKNRLYFDINDGNGTLSLCTGAYRRDGFIEGEPCSYVEESVECDEPFVRSPHEFTYRMLSRMKSDCDYFLGYGRRYGGRLHQKNVAAQIAEMRRLWDLLPVDGKPEWLTMEKIDGYEKQMLGV